jgi:N-acetylglutamate synthase-like GNAT family acetyltransferase
MAGGETIREARADEAGSLSELAFRAKAYWGYSDAFMAACRDELTYPPELIEAGGFAVAEVGGDLAGFYALSKVSPNTGELDAVFVDPERIGSGVGRALLDHALAAGGDAGLERIIVQADPNAAEFYERAGALRIGERESGSIAGRMLPLYEFHLTGD